MGTTSVRASSATQERLAYTFLDSAVGRLLLVGDERGLCMLSFARTYGAAEVSDVWLASTGPFQEAIHQLEAYFARELRSFTIPLHLVGTEFQLAAWNALRSIPYGHTTTYGWLARSLGKPGAIRAVGGANHANPVAIIVPCHRVIGSTGKLVGYGGGLETKQKLLALERGDLFL